MRKGISIGTVAAVLAALLLVPVAAGATGAVQYKVLPDAADDEASCPDFGLAGSQYTEGHYELRAGNNVIGYAEVCHEEVGGTPTTRQEVLLGRWHLNNDGDYVETIMDGAFVDQRNGPSLAMFKGDVVGGTGQFAGSTGTLKGHGTFSWQSTSNAWFNLHFVMHLD